MRKLFFLFLLIGVVCHATEKEGFDIGADLRIRQEWLNDLLTGAPVSAKSQAYSRVRTRLWLKYKSENTTAYLRAANMWRHYYYPSKVKAYQFPDQIYLDSAYFEWRNLFNDSVTVRIGRQDLQFGAGRIFSDGTPGDGGRSSYYDALRVTWKSGEKTTFDFFAIYNTAKTDLTIGRPRGIPSYLDERSLFGIETTSYDTYEAGLGVYAQYKHSKDLQIDSYAIWKHEGASLFGPNAYHRPGRDFLTVGSRITTKFSDEWSGELELAAQVGRTQDSRDIMAGMGYGKISRDWSSTSLNGSIYLACYALSGDKNQDKGTDTNWNPTFARSSQFNELFVYNMSLYGCGYWSNFVYPHLGLFLKTKETKIKFDATFGHVYAVAENGAGGGDGRDIGWLGQAVLDIPLKKDFFEFNDRMRGEIALKFIFSALSPGEFYAADDFSFFGRMELCFSF